jgi:L-lactate dehydrogenase complex protein LldG
MEGSIENQSVFLEKLYAKLGTKSVDVSDHPFHPVNDLPHQTLAGKTTFELLEIAKERSKKINAQILECELGDLSGVLKREILNYGGGDVLTSTDDRFSEFCLEQFLSEGHDAYEIHQWKKGEEYRDENIQQAQSSNIGIAFAEFLLAESCSVVVESHAGQGRNLHFLPTHYISIVPVSKVVTRTTAWADHYQEKLGRGERIGSDVNIISGPSNSGDIEMVLVTGLHGQIEVKYIVVHGI